MRLLLAEDEKSLSKAIAAILERNHYNVTRVYDGKDALEYLENGQYDGVVMDIMMPKLDGLSVLKIMRQRGDTTPVIMLTAKSDIDDRVTGLDSGANDYLTKPFDAKELLARIRAMTRASMPQSTSMINFGNITLDQANSTLTSVNGSIILTNKEFQMLELLISNPKRLVSTEQFMERIWGYESDTEMNVVWVYISYLRKNLTNLGANVSIRSMRNSGYILEENTNDKVSSN